jgi:hypothetical protein
MLLGHWDSELSRTHPTHRHRPPLPRGIAVGTTTDGLHHLPPPEALPRAAQPQPVGVEGGPAEEIRRSTRVVHHQLGGAVAKALHHRQVGVVAVGAWEGAGLEGLQEHGAAGGEAAAIALAPLSRVALLEARHPHQGGLLVLDS